MKHTIGIKIPVFLFPTEVKERGGYVRKVVTRHALNNFNKQAFEAAMTHTDKSIKTTLFIGDVAIAGLERYQQHHGIKSRNQAIIAILAAVYAETKPIIAAAKVVKLASVQVKIPVYQAMNMIGARG